KMIGAVVAFGALTIGFGLSPSLSPDPISIPWIGVIGAADMLFALACLVLIGAFDMLSVYVRSSLVQLHTPDSMRGRVSAVSGLAISASNELGEVQSGIAAALLGPVAAVIFGGAAAMAIALGWAWLFPELRQAKTFDPPDTLIDPEHEPATEKRT
nr:MFS transporter [Sphingopyxis sp.]